MVTVHYVQMTDLYVLMVRYELNAEMFKLKQSLQENNPIKLLGIAGDKPAQSVFVIALCVDYFSLWKHIPYKS
jgi:hypothetical protein